MAVNSKWVFRTNDFDHDGCFPVTPIIYAAKAVLKRCAVVAGYDRRYCLAAHFFREKEFLAATSALTDLNVERALTSLTGGKRDEIGSLQVDFLANT